MSVETPVETVAPVVRATHVKALVHELRKAGDWCTRKQLAALIGDGKPAWERKVRAIASVSAPQVVSFPGSPGYKLLSACTEEEIEHCIHALRAQATDMGRRANLYQHALNQRRTGRTVEVQESLAL
jgi:hypothetical protein